MSALDLNEFHHFLETLIESEENDGIFSVDRMVGTLLSKYPGRLKKIQTHINELGLRALIRNNCRSKNSRSHNQPDFFSRFQLGKHLSVPYYDAQGKLRWNKKRRSELSFEDLDLIIARSRERVPKKTTQQRAIQYIAKRIEPYRSVAANVKEALEMAERDGK